MKGQATAKLNFLRMSPRKVRLLADLIRGRKIAIALAQLEFNKKHASLPVIKLLKSAIANAKMNHGLVEDTLRVKTIMVDGGPILYRWMPKAMGRATPVRKRSSHITLILEGDVEEGKKAKTEVKKVAKKKVTKKTVAKKSVKKTVKKTSKK